MVYCKMGWSKDGPYSIPKITVGLGVTPSSDK